MIEVKYDAVLSLWCFENANSSVVRRGGRVHRSFGAWNSRSDMLVICGQYPAAAQEQSSATCTGPPARTSVGFFLLVLFLESALVFGNVRELKVWRNGSF